MKILVQYYSNNNTKHENYMAAQKKYNITGDFWWLRSGDTRRSNIFLLVYNIGSLSNGVANASYGVSPAFRIA